MRALRLLEAVALLIFIGSSPPLLGVVSVAGSSIRQPLVAQSTAEQPVLTIAGTWLAWSYSINQTGPEASTSSSQAGVVKVTVVEPPCCNVVVNPTVWLRYQTNFSSSIEYNETATGTLNAGLALLPDCPPNQKVPTPCMANQLASPDYPYIYLPQVSHEHPDALLYQLDGIFNSTTTANESVATGFGEVSAWVFEASGSWSNRLARGTASANFAFDSQLGLLLSEHAVINVTSLVSGNESAPFYVSTSIELAGMSAGVQLTPAAPKGPAYEAIAVLATVFAIAVVALVAAFLRKGKPGKGQTEPAPGVGTGTPTSQGPPSGQGAASA